MNGFQEKKNNTKVVPSLKQWLGFYEQKGSYLQEVDLEMDSPWPSHCFVFKYFPFFFFFTPKVLKQK